VQNEIGKIDILIVKEKDYTQENESEIRSKILNVTDIDISFKYATDIPRTKAGKHLFFIQNIKP
jgi:hypothetical protein